MLSAKGESNAKDRRFEEESLWVSVSGRVEIPSPYRRVTHERQGIAFKRRQADRHRWRIQVAGMGRDASLEHIAKHLSRLLTL